jgi:hypothetical protein
MGRNHQIGPRPKIDPPTEQDIAEAKRKGHDLSHLQVLPERDLPKEPAPGDQPMTMAQVQAIRIYASGIISGFCARLGLIDPRCFQREQLAAYRRNAFDMAEYMLAEEEARYEVV